MVYSLYSTVSAQLQNTEMKRIRETQSMRLRDSHLSVFKARDLIMSGVLQLIEVNYFHPGRCWCWWRRRKSSSGEKIDWKALDRQSR